MALRDAIIDDYLIFDNLEAVSFVAVANSGDSTTSISSALRRAMSYKEMMASGGQYTGKDLVWWIPYTLLSAAKTKDKVVDAAGVSWVVLDSTLNTLQTWWRLVTRNPTIAYDLRQLVTLAKNNTEQDEGKQRAPVWSPYKAACPASVTRDSLDIADAFGQRTGKSSYTVVIEEVADLSIEWQIWWGEKKLQIESVTKWGLVGELLQIKCTEYG